MSTEADDHSGYAHAAPAGVGLDLRHARERLGWTLPALSAHLRIRLPFLQAIEDGRSADLPGHAYAVGFVRTYAQSLGLDPDEIARRFRAEAALVNRKTALDFPAPVPERGVPALAVIAVGLVLAIGAYAGWYRMSGRDQSAADQVQPVPARLDVLSRTTPVPEAANPPAILPTAALPTAAAPSATPTQPMAAGAPAALPVVISPGLAVAPPPVPPPATAPPAAAPSIPVRADGARIVIRAKAEAWIQVRDAHGAVLVNRVLKPGDVWPVPPAPTVLLLTAGNPGGTELLVDGVVAPQIGVAGHVLRDFPLDADAIKDGRIATGSPPAPRATQPAASQSQPTR